MSPREYRASLRRDTQEGTYCAQFKTYHDEMKENKNEEPSHGRSETQEHCPNHFSDGSKIFPNMKCCRQTYSTPVTEAELSRMAEESCPCGDPECSLNLASCIARELAAARAAAKELTDRLAELFWTVDDDGKNRRLGDEESIRADIDERVGIAFGKVRALTQLNTHTHE